MDKNPVTLLDNRFVQYVLPLISIVLAVVVGSIAWQQSAFVKAQLFEQLSSKFPPTSNEGKRYKAIAEALKSGKTTYTYNGAKVPAAGK